MRVFVTGATGYLGGLLSQRLVEAGHEVRALVRPPTSTRASAGAAALARLGVATFTGDLGDRASMRVGMSGSDWVIHAAAELDPAAAAERIQTANVRGSDNVASLACKLGIGRFLSVSSVAFFGGSPDDGSAGTEESAARPPFPTAYSATKHAGQMAIKAYAARGLLRLNTVYPGLIYGPPGRRGGANPLLARGLRGGLPAIAGGSRKLSWIYLEDVVEAMLKVMALAPPGRDFVLAGEVATLRAVFEQVAALGGVRPPRWDLPLGVAKLLLAALLPFYRRGGRGGRGPGGSKPRRPPFSTAQLDNLSRHWAFDDARARRELGWSPRPLAQGLPPTVALLRAA